MPEPAAATHVPRFDRSVKPRSPNAQCRQNGLSQKKRRRFWMSIGIVKTNILRGKKRKRRSPSPTKTMNPPERSIEALLRDQNPIEDNGFTARVTLACRHAAAIRLVAADRSAWRHCCWLRPRDLLGAVELAESVHFALAQLPSAARLRTAARDWWFSRLGCRRRPWVGGMKLGLH